MNDTTSAETRSGRERAAAEDQMMQLIAEISDILRAVYPDDEQVRNHRATVVVNGLREVRGGSSTYILAPDKTSRNAAIRREFNGRNMSEVCRRYSLKPSQVYRIVGSDAAVIRKAIDPGK